jgi:hypothetical protein
LKYRRENTQPLQQVTLLAEHVATRHIQMAKGIIGMGQGSKTSSIRKGKASPKTSTHLSYRSTSKETLHQRLLKQQWWQLKHTYIQHDQIQETQGNICTGQHYKD